MRNAARLVALALSGTPVVAAAQGTSGLSARDSLVPPAQVNQLPRRGPSVGFLEVGLAAGAVALLSLADEPVQDEVQAHRTDSGDDFARVMRRMGEPVVYLPAALGTLGAGLLAGKPAVTRAGGRITGGLLLAGVATNLLKPLAGRRRPRFASGSYDLEPFTGRDSWPSGHTTMAFALATSVGDEIGSTPVRVALYGAATLTAWSRVNDDRHWLTDVATGALVGVVSAKVMNGRWRVFGVGAPRFLLGPGRVGVAMEF
jgi:membrane-associated phospholipid phosphatase